jgi:hypothetical protein
LLSDVPNVKKHSKEAHEKDEIYFDKDNLGNVKSKPIA